MISIVMMMMMMMMTMTMMTMMYDEYIDDDNIDDILDLTDRDHTQEGLTACGGSLQVCISLNTTSLKWSQTYRLLSDRSSHTSWSVNDGIILMGGSGPQNRRSIERVGPGESKIEHEWLKYDVE